MEFTGERMVLGQVDTELEIEHINRYKFARNIVKNLDVLDAACGTGYGTAILSKTANQVTGVDISEEAVRFAKERFESNNIKFEVASVTNLPYKDKSFGAIVSFETIEHIDESAQNLFLNEIKRLLKDDGILVISTPNHAIYKNRGENHFHVKEFELNEFRIFLGSKFKNVKLFSQQFEVCNIIVGEDSSEALTNNGLLLKKAEYILAVCSDDDLPEICASMTVRDDNKLNAIMDWAIGNHQLNEENNKKFESLRKDIEKQQQQLNEKNQLNVNAQNEIERLNIHIESLSNWGKKLDEEIAFLRASLQRAQEEAKVRNDVIQNMQNEKQEMRVNVKQAMDRLEKHIEEALGERNKLEKELQMAQQQLKTCNEILAKTEEELEASKEELETSKEKLAKKDEELNTSKQVLAIREKEISNYADNIEMNKMNYENDTKELRQLLLNKEGHIQLLLESDRELERIKGSRSWRYMQHIWHIRDVVVPRSSKRRLAIKLATKCIKSPFRVLKKLNPTRIKKFFYYLKREGVSSVSRRLDDCLIGNEIQAIPLEVANIVVERKKEISEYEAIYFSKQNTPTVSIIIPVYNQFDYTYNCLKSILQNSGDIAYEIIIANDCSTDLTTNIEEVVKNITVITNEQNLRFLKNCNNAACYAKGKYILFLNNDTQVQENWLAPLVELIERDDKIGMVGSKLVYADGTLQEAGGIFWDDASAWNYGNRSDPNDPEYNYVKEVDYISGAAIMIQHDLWKDIGGFDERFAPAYYEDSDLAFEVRKRGYKVMYQPLSVVVHFEGISNGTDISTGQKAYQIVNQQHFYEKWKEILEKDHYSNGQNVFKAKDRTRFKKHILIVDHYVPHHDKDAGGKCTYMYIKLFINLGMKVTFIGDNFFKHEPYTTELLQMGVEVLYGDYYCNNWRKWLAENGNNFDYAYLNRPHIAVNYIDLIRKHSNAKIIYFGHDLHYLREYRQYEIEKDPAILKSSNDWKKREFDLFNKADVIHVVGSYEQGILQQEFPNKPVRNIPVYIYDALKDSVNTDFKQRKDIIFVGGFGHPPNTDAVLWFAKEVFPSILDKYPDIKWYVVGSKVTDHVKALASDNIIITGFISDEELSDLYAKCRLAIVPLRVGAGVKGKVIEAVYNRIPLITTSIGAEGLSLKENAFIVSDGKDNMIRDINTLYENYEMLEQLSENSKAFIKNYFSVKTAKEVIAMDIEAK